jgi:hypothetical protein
MLTEHLHKTILRVGEWEFKVKAHPEFFNSHADSYKAMFGLQWQQWSHNSSAIS